MFSPFHSISLSHSSFLSLVLSLSLVTSLIHSRSHSSSLSLTHYLIPSRVLSLACCSPHVLSLTCSLSPSLVSSYGIIPIYPSHTLVLFPTPLILSHAQTHCLAHCLSSRIHFLSRHSFSLFHSFDKERQRVDDVESCFVCAVTAQAAATHSILLEVEASRLLRHCEQLDGRSTGPCVLSTVSVSSSQVDKQSKWNEDPQHGV